MTNRETVKTHLQIIHTWAEFSRERDLQFFTPKHLENIAEWMDDAIALLKEQEAELSYREAKSVTHTATKLDDTTCPSCGNVVGEKTRTGAIRQSVVQVRWNYCRFCGQKLDWERSVKWE